MSFLPPLWLLMCITETFWLSPCPHTMMHWTNCWIYFMNVTAVCICVCAVTAAININLIWFDLKLWEDTTQNADKCRNNLKQPCFLTRYCEEFQWWFSIWEFPHTDYRVRPVAIGWVNASCFACQCMFRNQHACQCFTRKSLFVQFFRVSSDEAYSSPH